MPVSDDVVAKQRAARKDGRPAFLHGNTLTKQFMEEKNKLESAVKKLHQLLVDKKVGENVLNNELSTPTGPKWNMNKRCRQWLRYQYRKSAYQMIGLSMQPTRVVG